RTIDDPEWTRLPVGHHGGRKKMGTPSDSDRATCPMRGDVCGTRSAAREGRVPWESDERPAYRLLEAELGHVSAACGRPTNRKWLARAPLRERVAPADS